MKLLVLAQTPPPVHGQSTMVETLVTGLPGRGIAVRQVNLRLSRDSGDIGRWRTGKVLRAMQAGLAARRLARQESCDALYYVPAPAKRAALWRDLAVLRLARPACPRLVLHWHAVGLGAWLESQGTGWERRQARRQLGGAGLSLVLAESLRQDAAVLEPDRIQVVPNGIADPAAASPPRARPPGRHRILFLGACIAEKGVLVLLEAVARLRQAGLDAEVVVAGTPPTPDDARRLTEAAQPLGPAVQLAGFVSGPEKDALFRSCDVFCLPTFYPHEAQPLVLLEALAHDLPIVATRWRGIPELLPPGNPLVVPRDVTALQAGLSAAFSSPPPSGTNRAHFLAHFTRDRHLAALAAALRSVGD
jgi:glycosyltransferase involved in cell wall biosynthesis